MPPKLVSEQTRQKIVQETGAILSKESPTIPIEERTEKKEALLEAATTARQKIIECPNIVDM